VVELSVANLINPAPRDGTIVACGNIARNLEAVSKWICRRSTIAHIARRILGWASSLDRMDDLENTVLGWWKVVGQGNLARATTMRSLAGELQ
jgi:hypothetical protein